MGEAKRKRQVQAAALYAADCGIGNDLALRRLRVLSAARKKERTACFCPECQKPELIIEQSDSEGGSYSSWVECQNCEYTSDVTKKFEPLCSFYAFDVVAAMADSREEQFGERWNAFALNDTIDMERDVLDLHKEAV